MGWFSRRTSTTPSPIEEICQLLVDKPLEWFVPEHNKKNHHYIEHQSGVRICWQDRNYGCDPVRVWIAAVGNEFIMLGDRDAQTAMQAILRNAAIRVRTMVLPMAVEIE